MKNAKIMKIIILITLGYSLNILSKDCCEKQFLEACENNQVPKVIYYLKKGININCTNSDKRTGLILATIKKHWPLCKFLIKNNADINHKDKYGWTMPMYAALAKKKS